MRKSSLMCFVFFFLFIANIFPFNTALCATPQQKKSSFTESLPKNLRFYVGGKLGFNQQFLSNGRYSPIAQLDRKLSGQGPSMSLGAMGGIRYTIIPKLHLRTEIEYLYRIPADLYSKHGVDIKTQIHSILTNAYIGYDVLPILNIYAGLGIGMGIIEPEDCSSQATFAWQIGAGTAIKLPYNLELDIAIRYTDFLTYKPEIMNTSLLKLPLSAVEVLVGIRYYF